MPDQLIGDKTTTLLVNALLTAAKERPELIGPIFTLIHQANRDTAQQLRDLIAEAENKDSASKMGTFDSLDDLINAPE